MKLKVNKVLIFAIVFVLGLGILILVARNSNETNGKDEESKIEQSKDETNSKDDNEVSNINDKKNEDSDLQVLEPDEIVPENSSDASGSWDNDEIGQTQGDIPNGTEEKEDEIVENEEKDKGILKDDTNWGNIY